jgi:hypothetical protein
MNNNRIQKFSSSGIFLSSAGTYGTGDEQLKYPYGIAVDNKDVVYVIDAFNHQIKKFDSNLRYLSKWGSPETIGIKLYMPHEIAVTNSGNVLLSDRQNHRIALFTNDGHLIRRFGDFAEGKSAMGGYFSEPHGIAINKNGDILICDRYNFRVQKFSPDMEYQMQWMTSGIFEDSKYFPLGVACSQNELVYVTDHYAHAVHFYKLLTKFQR